MRSMKRIMAFVFVSLMGLVLFAGCAAQNSGTDELSDDPKLIQDELEEIAMDLENVLEMLVANKVEQQMEDGTEIRKTIRDLEMKIYQLRSQESALKERIAELEAAGKL